MESKEPRIIYDDPFILVVSKPPGMHTAPLSCDESGTLVSWVVERYPDIRCVTGKKPEEPGLIHRLDRETSGLVLFARTAEAYRSLLVQSNSFGVKKYYRAFCTIGPVSLPPEGFDTRSWEDELHAKKQTTGEYRIRSRFRPFGPGRKLVHPVPSEVLPSSTKEVSPRVYETIFAPSKREDEIWDVRAVIFLGFRHQIRVHLASAGLPIMGDPLYGSPGNWERMYLHAESLTFIHPAKGIEMELEDPAPFS
jgi:23S rRNA pseudouridine1911/1915/1917 synthase